MIKGVEIGDIIVPVLICDLGVTAAQFFIVRNTQIYAVWVSSNPERYFFDLHILTKTDAEQTGATKRFLRRLGMVDKDGLAEMFIPLRRRGHGAWKLGV